jgi:hypothetical protein
MCSQRRRSYDPERASPRQGPPANRWMVVIQQRFAVFARRWFTWADGTDYLIRRATTAYWLAPAWHRDVAPTSPKPLSPALLLRPLV